MSLEQCLADWIDISALCQRRRSRKSDWRTDTGYGLLDIYIDAAGLPGDYRAHINVLHGTFTGMADHWFRTSEAGFRSVPATFVHNDADRDHLERIMGSYRRFLVAPHPFHYLIRNYEQTEAPPRVGSVFFLPHSTSWLRPRVPLPLVIKTLRALPSDYWPIDICLHPADVANIGAPSLERYGFGLVSAGQRHDPLFLHRFYWICRRRRHALSVDDGTHVWLAALSGLHVQILEEIPDVAWMPVNNSFDWISAPMPQYRGLFAQLHSRDVDQQRLRSEVSQVTGGDRWLSVTELRDCFLQAERWYRSWRLPSGKRSLSPQVWSTFERSIINVRALRSAIINRLSGRRGRLQPYFPDTPWRLMQYELSNLAGEQSDGTINSHGISDSIDTHLKDFR